MFYFIQKYINLQGYRIPTFLKEADMKQVMVHISLIALGFYYGALFITLAPDSVARIRNWFSGGPGGKKNTPRLPKSPRRYQTSPGSSIDFRKLFMAHWVTPGNHGQQKPVSSNVFSLSPFNRQLWNPLLPTN